MKNALLLLTVAAMTFGLPFTTLAEEKQKQVDSDQNQVTALTPNDPEISAETESKLHNFKYIHCDYNFLGRILIRDGQFYFGLRGEFIAGEGLWVESVERNSPAAKAGLAPGMLITGLNGYVPDTRGRFDQAFEKFDGILKLAYETSGASSARNLKFDMRTHYIAAK